MLTALTDAATAFGQAVDAYTAPAVDWMSSATSDVVDIVGDAITNSPPGIWLVLGAVLIIFWSSFFRRL